jgi:hypothetical protein
MADNVAVKVVHSSLPTDTSNLDLTVAGESRTPTGCIIVCSQPVALDTLTTHLSHCIGGTDFTDQACIGMTDKSAETIDTLCSMRHQETYVLYLLNEGISSADRTCTVSAITGGIRLAPQQTGLARQVTAWIVFGTACKFFSSNGDGDLGLDEAFNVAHGMTTYPKAGIYFSNQLNVSTGADTRFSVGFHAYDGTTIEQSAVGFVNDAIATTTNNSSRLQSDIGSTPRVAVNLNQANGNLRTSFELTSVDTTNIQYTMRGTNTTTSKLCGLLLECDGVDTQVSTIDSPTTSASDWNYNGLDFTPQFLAMVTNRILNDNNGETGSNACTGGLFAVDSDGTEITHSFSSQDGIVLGTTNTQSEVITGLHCPTQFGADSHNMDTIVFTSDGFDVAAADIFTADGTARKWPMLAIGEASANVVINKVLTTSTIITDAAPGTQLKARPGDRVETMTDAMFLYSALGRLIKDYFSPADAIRILGAVDRQLFVAITAQDFSAISRRVFNQLVDAIEASDVIRKSLATGKIQTDQMDVLDAFIKYNILTKTPLDELLLSDKFQKTITRGLDSEVFLVVIEDFVPILDTPSIVKSGVIVKNAFDSISIAESDFISRVLNRIPSEQLDVGDFIGSFMIRNQASTDTIAASDNLSPRRTRRNRYVETIQATADLLDPFVVHGRLNNDQSAVTDDVIVTRSAINNLRTLADTMNLTDFRDADSGSLLPPPTEIEIDLELYGITIRVQVFPIEHGIE